MVTDDNDGGDGNGNGGGDGQGARDLTPMLGARPQFIPIMNINGNDYLGVAEAIAWARRDWGLRLQIVTDLLVTDGQGRPEGVKAELYIDGVLVATGMARIDAPRGSRGGNADESDLENGETSAIGRALRAMGYSTSQALAYNGHAPRQPQQRQAPQRAPQGGGQPQGNADDWVNCVNFDRCGNRHRANYPMCYPCSQEQRGADDMGAS